MKERVIMYMLRVLPPLFHLSIPPLHLSLPPLLSPSISLSLLLLHLSIPLPFFSICRSLPLSFPFLHLSIHRLLYLYIPPFLPPPILLRATISTALPVPLICLPSSRCMRLCVCVFLKVCVCVCMSLFLCVRKRETEWGVPWRHEDAVQIGRAHV